MKLGTFQHIELIDSAILSSIFLIVFINMNKKKKLVKKYIMKRAHHF
jgi:hypothetical protein